MVRVKTVQVTLDPIILIFSVVIFSLVIIISKQSLSYTNPNHYTLKTTNYNELDSYEDDTSDTTDTSDEEDYEPYRENIPMRGVRRMPVNIATTCNPLHILWWGFLQDSEDPSKLQQLYGRQTYPNSNQWNYFVKSDQYHQIPIPLNIEGQNCTEERVHIWSIK